ncbi:MAG: hypothetical protein ABIK83_07785 [Candidatus Zixiibacteriota bacterium]
MGYSITNLCTFVAIPIVTYLIALVFDLFCSRIVGCVPRGKECVAYGKVFGHKLALLGLVLCCVNMVRVIAVKHGVITDEITISFTTVLLLCDVLLIFLYILLFTFFRKWVSSGAKKVAVATYAVNLTGLVFAVCSGAYLVLLVIR